LEGLSAWNKEKEKKRRTLVDGLIERVGVA
jgi:hypothetical protein